MLAYAPRRERRRLQASTLALIIGAHALAVVAVMTTKMDVPERWKAPKTEVTFVPLPPEPVPEPAPPNNSRPTAQPLDSPRPIIEPLPFPTPNLDPQPMPIPDPRPIFGNGTDSSPMPQPAIRHTGPRFATPDSAIRPPYPEEKRRLEQEATLRLRLSIDERGRVVAVEPVGRADPAFLAAARRHILKAWRYQPAMEGERAIASSTMITLEFKLN